MSKFIVCFLLKQQDHYKDSYYKIGLILSSVVLIFTVFFIFTEDSGLSIGYFTKAISG